MNRSNYKVLVSDRKQAKAFKKVLEVLGEKLCDNYYDTESNHEYQNELVFDSEDKAWLCYNHDNVLEAITIRELVMKIASEGQAEEPVKPSLLDGKVAIQVNNEREFKLLMEHYESKGWVSGALITYEHSDYYCCYDYHDKFRRSSLDIQKSEGYAIIPFATFAAEVNIKVPAFVANSTDGVPIYEGDKYHGISRDYVGNWCYSGFYPIKTNINIVLGKDLDCKAFSTKEAAEKWIADQNKPKEIKVKLFNKHQSATIRKYSVDVSVNSLVIRLSPSDLEDMLHIYKQAYA